VVTDTTRQEDIMSHHDTYPQRWCRDAWDHAAETAKVVFGILVGLTVSAVTPLLVLGGADVGRVAGGWMVFGVLVSLTPGSYLMSYLRHR
jgi:anti-sigma factor RsiW